MKISELHAEQVYGHLSIEVNFFDDITFLTGLNGSGKTTALRLLMALIMPNIEELQIIRFSTASVTINNLTERLIIQATKAPDTITLSVSSLDDALVMNPVDLELYLDTRRRDEAHFPIIEKYQRHPVYQMIKSISTPMFLGIDRRFYVVGEPGADEIADTRRRDYDARRREYMARRYWPEDALLRGSGIAALMEINYLAVMRTQEVLALQEQLDERLRTQFFAKAFEYKPSDIAKPARLPSRPQLDQYRKQLAKIEMAAEDARIPVPEIQTALSHFFERMSAVVESLDKITQTRRPMKKPGKKIDKNNVEITLSDNNYIEWIINKPQADRILEHLKILDEYVENRNALRDPIKKFLALVNSFFIHTKKHVSVEENGHLTVALDNIEKLQPISALSSGERQLLVMLAHLSLNPSLAGSGIFIVDEPELSLHIDWQEKFVDAIQKANPNVQLILATHSPAIILDRTESCRTLSG